MNLIKFTAPAICAAAFLAFTSSCTDDGDGTLLVTPGSLTDIPSDDDADPNPSIGTSNTNIPNIQYTTVDENGEAVIRLDMTGIQDPSTGSWLKLYGTGHPNQNVWVEVDGTPKGIAVSNASDNNDSRTSKIDVVFLVDNSGSMSEEADVIARDIDAWAQKLSSTLDVRFGCVGYGGNVGANDYAYLLNNYGVTGALNISSYKLLNDFLNKRSNTGTSRTKGFYGDDANSLKNWAESYYNKAGGECGVQALQFANERFTFRKGANRIYINFTDDANYHGESESLKVSYLDSSEWATSNGTIHTVFSGDKAHASTRSHGDAPWLMSEYTGGTTLYTNSSFTGISLDTLPVSGAMQNSYIIRFTNVAHLMDGKPHTVHVTVRTPDGKVKSERTFSVVFKPL